MPDSMNKLVEAQDQINHAAAMWNHNAEVRVEALRKVKVLTTIRGKWALRETVIKSDEKGFCDISGRTFLHFN